MFLSIGGTGKFFLKSHLTYGTSVPPENAVTYSAGNGGQKICGDLPETTAFKSYAAKHERKSQYANYSDLPDVSFLRLIHSEGPEGKVNGGNFEHVGNSGQRQFLQRIGRRRHLRR